LSEGAKGSPIYWAFVADNSEQNKQRFLHVHCHSSSTAALQYRFPYFKSLAACHQKAKYFYQVALQRNY
jgi:transposase-like protein